ncbi:MAG: class I SAM-dependent methyltransferase [Planctomycetota bacterium]
MRHCQSCQSTDLDVIYELQAVPVHSCLLIESRADALAFPRGDLKLAFCRSCGFISNLAFDDQVQSYSAKYEETQGFSPHFRQFTQRLATQLIERHGLHDKRVLEIGCGKGEFLVSLCELGPNRGVGFDPGYIAERTSSAAASRIEFVKDFYSEKYAHVAADFVCCRHTLEHIHRVREFIAMVAQAIASRPDTVVFFELPDVLRILQELAFWDVYYEHCSYFSTGSLARLFRSCGFDILRIAREYDDQYITIEARLGRAQAKPLPDEQDLEPLRRAAEHFQHHVARKIGELRQGVQAFSAKQRKVVLWGSGSKAVAYLTTMGIEREIEYVVDINPYKHGVYMAGTGQQIVAPEFLKQYQPDVVIAMNPIYKDEIQRDLDRLGVRAELMAV